MEIITLIDNENNKQDLFKESGLSLYVKIDDKQILFDTGRTDKFLYNAKKLGVEIEDIDYVVISHGHSDHGGGLYQFLLINKKAKVFLKKEAANNFYMKFLFLEKYIGLEKSLFEKFPDRFVFVNNNFEITPKIILVSGLEKRTGIPHNDFMYVKDGQCKLEDLFEHELVMVLKDLEGISIFTGCSHNGIVNIIDSVREYFPLEEIRLLVGGMHLDKLPKFGLLPASTDEINLLCDKLINENVGLVLTGHCTGRKSYKNLKGVLGARIEQFYSGFKIDI